MSTTDKLRSCLAAAARIALYGASADDHHETHAAAIILARDLPRVVEGHRDQSAPTASELDVPVGGATR